MEIRSGGYEEVVMTLIRSTQIVTGIHITHEAGPSYEELKRLLLTLPEVRLIAEGGHVAGSDLRVAVIVPRDTTQSSIILRTLEQLGAIEPEPVNA